ncbi:enoyl-CoA hydratase-related protein [Croceicoccus mobilis]|uniref:Enoyl-CoA hydratase n=1 Tax=Croceicoccus mobilis TaxID=1703339 RepID=A0A917DZS1_9SPHN|nr:enoyl-CoA hydratase-related protein [Croceicoccus mobilis]GGD84720.1 enoyl-CoA hydratase [Croceicoccus mobilis]
MDDLQFSRVAIDGAIALVTIYRPARMNALHPAAHQELQRVFDGLVGNAGLRCIVLTGEGSAFCAGYDLKDNLETGVMELAADGFAGLTLRHHFPLPIVAAVNGICMGGGFELALACDLIIAADNAVFALPEPKVGWSPLGGGLQRLPRAIGEKRAASILLTGRNVSAQEGESLGFVNEVVTPDMLQKRAMDWARQIAACAPIAIRCNRIVAGEALNLPLSKSLLPDRFAEAEEVMASEDAVEGKRAFVEKRPPLWRNR